MAKLHVNPTRNELKRLKERLKMAVRGHKLLKDKSDEMVRRFLIFARQNKQMRETVETELSQALRAFMIARALMTPQAIEQAIGVPSSKAEIIPSTQNVMGLICPKLTLNKLSEAELYPYSFSSTSAELDISISRLALALEKMVMLAEAEKTCSMLAAEIEKNKRRVNALEHVLIPQLQETIKFIIMKLDENERANIIRVMKIKSLIEKDTQIN